MSYKIGWIRKRLKYIIFLLVELSIYLISIATFIDKQEVFSSYIYILPLISWLFISYITGRYHTYKSYTLTKNIFVRSFQSSICILFTISINFIAFLPLDLIKSPTKDLWLNLLEVILSLGILSYSIFFMIHYLLFKRIKKKSEKKNWLFLGNKNSLNELLVHTKSKLSVKDIILVNELYPSIDIKANKYNGIILSKSLFIDELLENKLLELKAKGLLIVDILSWCEFELQRYPTDLIDFKDLIKNTLVLDTSSINFRVKRVIDILISAILIVFSTPLILFIALFIFIEDRGPIFYSQVRRGYKGLNFRLWKLRSMRKDSEPDGAVWAKSNDKRVTRVGRFIRSTGIDEIPQLYNIFKGDMSIIGPRPERPEIDKDLIDKIPLYKLRTLYKPGLSGWAQVNYPYASSFEDTVNKLSYDIYYMKNFSLWLDLLIFFKTIRLVFNLRKMELE